MKPENRILICGASISGTAIAFWLEKYGYELVVVEKAKEFREGGQNVDIKGPGRKVIKMMGLEEEINAKNTGEKGIRYLNKSGDVFASFPKDAIGGLTSSFEILRGDLAKILYDKTAGKCEYRFGTYVTSVSDNEQGATVTFNDGSAENFALIICAEGIGSGTRDLVMPEFTHFNYLGAYMSFFTIPKEKEDDLWAKAFHATGGTMVFLRPGHENETTVLVTFLNGKFEPDLSDVAKQKERLNDVLSGKGKVADRVANKLDQVKDLYFGPMSQVKASQWSKGRVVLLGDAAHAPTPFTGLGTALSLVGAYILAGELKNSADITSAFERYERIFRPYVETSQKQISARMVNLIHPASKTGIAIAGAIFRICASSPVQKILAWSSKANGTESKDSFVLPVY